MTDRDIPLNDVISIVATVFGLVMTFVAVIAWNDASRQEARADRAEAELAACRRGQL